MANSTLVQHFSGNVVPGTLCGDTPHKESTLPEKPEELHVLWSKLTLDGESVKEAFFSSQGFDNNDVDILKLETWRQDTFSNFSLYMSKWFKYASCNNVSPA